MNIYVGNLSAKTTDQELREAFESFGEVDTAKIIKDNITGRSRGFGFVEMPNQDQAQTAIAEMNGKELGGSALTVNEAKPRESRGGRSYGSGGRPGGGRPGGGGGFGGGRDRRGGGGGAGRRSY
jgi:RNA recognition motif-containing protein